MTLTLLERLRQIDRATVEAAEALDEAATALGEYARLVEHQARRIERLRAGLRQIQQECLWPDAPDRTRILQLIRLTYLDDYAEPG